MTQPAFGTTLSADELDMIQITAKVWRERGFGATADNLLVVAGLSAPVPQPSALPPNVYPLSAYRARRAAS